jgi:hypothetical protein
LLAGQSYCQASSLGLSLIDILGAYLLKHFFWTSMISLCNTYHHITMSARSEVIQGLKQFTDRSVELMRVIKSVSTGHGSAESPEGIMKLLIHTDSSLQAAVLKCMFDISEIETIFL